MLRLSTPVIAVVAVFLTTSCGQNNVVVSPATADAQQFPSGIVQFTATGVSSPVWCIGSAQGMCNGNVVSIATIDSSGRAQCLSGKTGTVTVLAGAGLKTALPDGGGQLSSFGSAQLTCP